MLINKEGRIIANASQPTVIFETEEDYNKWEATLPLAGKTEAEIEKILARFIIVKKYEVVEVEGMVIFCADETEMKDATKHKALDGALYLTEDNNKLFRYDATEKKWIVISSGGSNAEFAATATAFPGTTAGTPDATHAKFPDVILPENYQAEDRFFVARDTMQMYVIEEKTPATTPKTYKYTQISAVVENVIIRMASTKAKLQTLVVNYAQVADIPANTEICYVTATSKFYKKGASGDATEIADAELPIFPTAGSTTILYVAKKEGILYIWDGTNYIPVGGADEVQVYPTKASFPAASDAQEGKLYVALDEAQSYVYGTVTVPAVGFKTYSDMAGVTAAISAGTLKDNDFFYYAGADEDVNKYGRVVAGTGVVLGVARVGDKTVMTPTKAGEVLYNNVGDNELWISNNGSNWDEKLGPIEGSTSKNYISVSSRVTVLYASKTAFPTIGIEGMIYIAKDTGKVYYWDPTTVGADKYKTLGDSRDEVVCATLAEIEAMPSHEDGVLYVATDTYAIYTQVEIEDPDTKVKSKVLKPVGGTGMTPMTQAAWDKAAETGEQPELAFITDSVYDADGYK